ncbi:lysostaphin resistance A-like protein [Halosegnis sp.]|uniref:CPBP family intramembrane glutamic endopeptidase n=1 Tax=Halosegnis sp. TaxID=2864959 RepID=UPI0035D45B07
METRGGVRALLSGYGLGLGGAALALVLTGVGLFAAGAVGLAGTTAQRFLLVFVLGQYLPFLGLPLVYFRARGMDARAIRRYLGVRLPSLRELGVVVAGLFGILVLASAASAVVGALGLEPATNSAATQAQQSPELIPLLVAAMFLVVAPCEETLFRGTVQNRLREAFPATVAIPLTAALFAAVHYVALVPGSGSRLVTVVVLFVPSLVFGAIYEYTDNLLVPIGTHALWNSLLLVSILVAG